MTGLVRPLLQPLVAGLLDARKTAAEPLPVIDYLVMVGSSSTEHTYGSNPILGNQIQPSRAAFCAEGIDVPIVGAGIGGSTIANIKDTIAATLSNLGPIPTGKRIGVIVCIGVNDIPYSLTYQAATQEKRDQMRNDLIAILATIRNAGYEPILSTLTTPNGGQVTFETWADNLYHPLAVQETPNWTRGGRCVFDYTQLYRDNMATPNWWNPDNTHPWMATQAMQTYTAQRIKQYARVPQLGSKERFIFAAYNGVVGGFNIAPIAATLSTVLNWRGQTVAGVSLTTFGTDGATLQRSTAVRGNAGVLGVGLYHHRAQSANIFLNNPLSGRQQWTANFGAGYASRTGTLRATLNSSLTPRRTRITLPNAATVDVQGETGIEVKELPFVLDASGSIMVDMYRVATQPTAISALEFEFD